MTPDDWKWIGVFALSWLGMMYWIIWKAVRDDSYPTEPTYRDPDDL